MNFKSKFLPSFQETQIRTLKIVLKFLYYTVFSVLQTLRYKEGKFMTVYPLDAPNLISIVELINFQTILYSSVQKCTVSEVWMNLVVGPDVTFRSNLSVIGEVVPHRLIKKETITVMCWRQSQPGKRLVELSASEVRCFMWLKRKSTLCVLPLPNIWVKQTQHLSENRERTNMNDSRRKWLYLS